MPCFSRETSTIEWGASTDPKLLAAAFRALGYTVTQLGKDLTFAKRGVTGTYTPGLLTVQAVQGAVDENEIKRAYSAEVIKSAAQRFGWQAKQSATEPNKFQVQRRV